MKEDKIAYVKVSLDLLWTKLRLGNTRKSNLKKVLLRMQKEKEG